MRFRGKFINEKGEEIIGAGDYPNEEALKDDLKKRGWQAVEYHEVTVKESEEIKARTSFSNAAGFLGSVIGVAVGIYSRLNLLIPLGGAYLSFWLLKKYKKEMSRHILIPFSIQAGHLLWMSAGILFSLSMSMFPWENAGIIVLEILITAGGLFWLISRPSIWPIVFLCILQLIGLVNNSSQLIVASLGSSESRALLVHVIFRGCAILFMMLGYHRFKKETTLSETRDKPKK
jgi:hypothetical protein